MPTNPSRTILTETAAAFAAVYSVVVLALVSVLVVVRQPIGAPEREVSARRDSTPAGARRQGFFFAHTHPGGTTHAHYERR